MPLRLCQPEVLSPPPACSKSAPTVLPPRWWARAPAGVRKEPQIHTQAREKVQKKDDEKPKKEYKKKFNAEIWTWVGPLRLIKMAEWHKRSGDPLSVKMPLRHMLVEGPIGTKMPKRSPPFVRRGSRGGLVLCCCLRVCLLQLLRDPAPLPAPGKQLQPGPRAPRQSARVPMAAATVLGAGPWRRRDSQNHRYCLCARTGSFTVLSLTSSPPGFSPVGEGYKHAPPEDPAACFHQKEPKALSRQAPGLPLDYRGRAPVPSCRSSKVGRRSEAPLDAFQEESGPVSQDPWTASVSEGSDFLRGREGPLHPNCPGLSTPLLARRCRRCGHDQKAKAGESAARGFTKAHLQHHAGRGRRPRGLQGSSQRRFVSTSGVRPRGLGHGAVVQGLKLRRLRTQASEALLLGGWLPSYCDPDATTRGYCGPRPLGVSTRCGSPNQVVGSVALRGGSKSAAP